MNKRINFEDTTFIINVRIRMIRDLMRLDTDASVFLRQSFADIDFISTTLDMLNEKFLANIKFLDRETEADNLLDTEWQFSQLLNELSGNSSPFSPVRFPETQEWIEKYRKNSVKRQKVIEEYAPVGHTVVEPVVSNAEINGLLGSA